MTAEQNESKNRTVHYRKCEIVADLFTQLHGKTLENLLDEAFDKLDGSSGINRPYNGNSDIIEEFSAPYMKLAKYGACKCGVTFLTQEGKHVPAKGVSDAGVFITNAEPVTEKGVSADPVEKIVIFAVSGNHLAYVADTGNGDIRLKKFFSWILQSRTHLLPISTIIELSNDVRIDIQESIKKYGVKTVQLDYKPNQTCGEIGYEVKKSLTCPASPIIHVIPPPSLDDCRVQVIISSGSKKNHDLESIRKLAKRATDTDLDNLSVILKNGQKINKDKLLPCGKIPILFKNGVISQINAMQFVSKWLTSQLEENIIR